MKWKNIGEINSAQSPKVNKAAGKRRNAGRSLAFVQFTGSKGDADRRVGLHIPERYAAYHKHRDTSNHYKYNTD